jgi:hypothetical protein
MTRILAFGVLAVAALALAACANIRLSENGKNVIVMKPLEIVEKCENLGTITVNATNVNKSQEAKDREILARNEAAKLGGNVVVAAGEAVDKAQEWTAYRCK